MKQTIVSKMLCLFSASVLLLSCSKDAKQTDQMEQSMMGRNDKSMNLKKQYRATLSSLNGSGVSGVATLMLDGNMLTVTIQASGLEAAKPHPQHIHGFTANTRNSTCPTMSADTNGDGLVDLQEGLPSYGPILLDLTPTPVADANGNISYTQTFTIDASVTNLQNRAIVLHGLTVMGQYWATLPVACGQIQNWNQ